MKARTDEMTERQAARIIEMFENASRNGEEWAHDVFLHRGTDKYENQISRLNEAFGVKSIRTIVKPLKIQEKQRKPGLQSLKK